MSLRNDDGHRICEVCKQPLKTQHCRWDTKTCSPKCRQQAHRNRVFAAEEAARQKRRDHDNKERLRKQKYNAKRKNAPKKPKPMATIPLKDLCTLHKKARKSPKPRRFAKT